MAYENIMALIQQQAVSQLNGMGGFLGGDRVLPSSPVSGPLNSLRVSPVSKFTEAMFPGVGYIEVEHDPTLDYNH